MPKFIETEDGTFVNVDQIIEIRVGVYEEGKDMIGIVKLYQIEAWMKELGWTKIKDGFEKESQAKRALIKLVLKMQE